MVNNIQSFVVAVAVLAALDLAASFPKNGDVIAPQQLNYLGMVDRKQFFVERAGSALTWAQARNYCKASAMALASIETGPEANFLFDNLKNFTENPVTYWTSAREFRHHSSFVWDENEMRPDLDVVNDWIHLPNTTAYSLCGMFSVVANETGQMQTSLCSTARVGTLCQLVLPA